MSPEPVLFESPTEEEGSNPFANEGDKIQCPECSEYFSPRGIKRHITMTHRGGISDDTETKPNKAGGKRSNLATRWEQFQLGAGVIVSMACADCGAILARDANEDAKAIDDFCRSRPKLRKQIEDLLNASDFMLLIGAFGKTVKDMVSHHSIGAKVGLHAKAEHSDAHSPQDKMMAFMSAIPPEQRHQIIDSAVDAQAEMRRHAEAVRQRNEQLLTSIPQPVVIVTAPDPEPLIIVPETGERVEPTEHDKELIAAMNGGGDFATAAALSGYPDGVKLLEVEHA